MIFAAAEEVAHSFTLPMSLRTPSLVHYIVVQNCAAMWMCYESRQQQNTSIKHSGKGQQQTAVALCAGEKGNL